MRADARDNRRRILDAARHAFADRGRDVPLAAIARRAGVGTATVYRHFPSRRDLVTAVVAHQMEGCLRHLADGLADPDAWRGFRTVIGTLSAEHATGHGVTADMVELCEADPEFDRHRKRAERDFAELVRRAKATGRLRADFTRDDLTLLLMTSSGITAASPEAAVAASRRLTGMLLQSLQSDAPLPPPAPLGPYHVRGGSDVR